MIPDVYHGDPIYDMGAFLDASDFVILKATQGTSYVDPTYAARAAACRGRGKPFWAYAFMERGADAAAQADHLLAHAGDGYVGLCLDVETYRGSRPTREQVRQAYDGITGRGIKCLVYYMDSQGGDYHGIAGGELGADWVARYGRNDGTVSRRPDTPCDLHQYTSSGSMPGASGACDLSRVTGQGHGLDWFAGRAAQTTGTDDEEETTMVIIHPGESPLSGGLFLYTGDKVFALSNPDQVAALDMAYQTMHGRYVPRMEMGSDAAPWFVRLVEACGGVVYRCPAQCSLDEIVWR